MQSTLRLSELWINDSTGSVVNEFFVQREDLSCDLYTLTELLEVSRSSICTIFRRVYIFDGINSIGVGD